MASAVRSQGRSPGPSARYATAYDDPNLRRPPLDPRPLRRAAHHAAPVHEPALRVRRGLSRPGLVPLRGDDRGDGEDDGGRGRAGDDLRRTAGLTRAARDELPQVTEVRDETGDA